MIDSAASSAWSITRLNTEVRNRIESSADLQGIWIQGEIYNLTKHSSGHIYLTLKDETSVIRCTFFKGANQYFKDVPLRQGTRITAFGSVSVYTQRGEYQFNITKVNIAGEGDLRLKIEQLKKKLYEEGLFSDERKRPLPFYPVTLGVATAPTGAAVQDIIRVARMRNPDINIVLAPCLVQGDGAPESICKAIQFLNMPEWGVDVIIAGRGGGSFEDLLAFNDESVVRAYASSRIPIVSAVGHEIDHPLTDLAADAFASTPSAAVQLAVPVKADLEKRIGHFADRLTMALNRRWSWGRQRLETVLYSRVYQNPLSVTEMKGQHLDRISKEMSLNMAAVLLNGSMKLSRSERIGDLFRRAVTAKRNSFSLLEERLTNFSPLSTLKRGYAVARSQDGDVVRSWKDVQKGDLIEVILGEGSLQAEVKNVSEVQTGR